VATKKPSSKTQHLTKIYDVLEAGKLARTVELDEKEQLTVKETRTPDHEADAL
jgi:hypothetical protein